MKLKKEKQIITDTIEYIDVFEFFNKDLKSIISELTFYQDEYKKYNKIYFDYEHNECSASARMYGQRLETDEELQNRIAIEIDYINKQKNRNKIEKENKIKQEKELLAKLLKKYPPPANDLLNEGSSKVKKTKI